MFLRFGSGLVVLKEFKELRSFYGYFGYLVIWLFFGYLVIWPLSFFCWFALGFVLL